MNLNFETKVTYSFGNEACSATQLCKPNLDLTCQSNLCKCTTVNTYWSSAGSTCCKKY